MDSNPFRQKCPFLNIKEFVDLLHAIMRKVVILVYVNYKNYGYKSSCVFTHA